MRRSHQRPYYGYGDYYPIVDNFMLTPSYRPNDFARIRTRRQLMKANTMNTVLLGTLAVVGVGALVGVVAYAASK